MPIRVEVIQSSDRLASVRPEWAELLDRAQPHSVFSTPQWLTAWWDIYGEGATLFIVTVRDGDRLIGILPLYITGDRSNGRESGYAPGLGRRQLRFLGSTAVCSDHGDGLADKEYEKVVVAAWQTSLRERAEQFDSVVFADLAAQGLLNRSLSSDPDAWGRNVAWRQEPSEACPYIPLPDSWEAYLSGLSAKTRREIRHDRRMLEKLGLIKTRVIANVAELDGAMATFMRLNQMRRQELGEKGPFSDEHYRTFHLNVSRALAEAGWLRLTLLDIDGVPAAARYQFAYRGRVHDYLPGHDPKWHKHSVGLVLLSHCVEFAISRHDREIDLLRGDEGYKTRWASHRRQQVTWTGSSRLSRAWCAQTVTRGIRASKEAAKQVLPPSATEKLRRYRRGCTKPQYVPFYPSTSLHHLIGRPPVEEKPFPLSNPRAYYYYFARNGIWHAIDILGLTPETEVLMPAYNNGMEVAPFQVRKIPLRYVHVDRQMTLDLKDLERKITPRTRMIYVIHYLGFPQPMDEIRALCRRHNLLLFEDCALSFGSFVNGQPLGSFGDVSIFCLAKFVPVPNGGVLVLNNPELKAPLPTVPPSGYSVASQLVTKLLDHWETHGGTLASRARRFITRSAQWGVRRANLKRVDAGVMQFLVDKVNWGMAPVSKRVLNRVDYVDVYEKRRQNYQRLLDLVAGTPGVTPIFPALPDGVCPLFLPLLVDDSQAVCEDLIQRRICGGGFWSWFPPGVPTEEFPDTVFLRKHVLELQVHQDLDLPHLEITAEALRAAMRQKK